MGSSPSSQSSLTINNQNRGSGTAEAISRGLEGVTRSEELISDVANFPSLIQSRSRVEGLTVVLRDKEARSKFVSFLASDVGRGGSNFISEIVSLRAKTFSELSSLAKSKSLDYTTPDSHDEDVTNLFIEQSGSSLVEGISTPNILELTENSINEVVVLSILQSMPQFMQSKSYLSWKHGDGAKLVKFSAKPGPADHLINFEELILAVVKSWESQPEHNVFVSSLIKSHLDIDKTSLYLNTYGWLATLVKVIKNLPIGCFIADGDNLNPGFPIIYANPKFEQLTGYSLDEVIGQNCRFLQGNKTSPKAIVYMADSLQSIRPTKIQVLNYRKDGTPFLNLLYMAPVFDLNGKLHFMISLIYDCSSAGANAQEMLITDMFINLMPTTCPIWRSFS